MCSHTVAAAEYNKSLDQFISSYGSVKKVPNITKLATTGMPKGRGWKGTKAPAKRRPPIPVETRIELHPHSSEPTGTMVGREPLISPSVSAVYQPSLTAPISVTIGASSLPSPFVPRTAASFPSPFSPSAAAPYSSPYSPIFSTPCLSPPCMHPQSQPLSYYGLDPSGGGANPFRVHFIMGNISVCNGCKRTYDKKIGLPHDLCLQHEEWRTFTPPGSSDKQSRFGNVYYHCNVACIMAIWPTFIATSVVVPPEIQHKLLPEHKHFIYATFGVFIM